MGGIHHIVMFKSNVGASGEVTCRTMWHARLNNPKTWDRSGIDAAPERYQVPVARALRGSLLGRPPDSDLLMVRLPAPGRRLRSPLAVRRMKLVTALGP